MAGQLGRGHFRVSFVRSCVRADGPRILGYFSSGGSTFFLWRLEVERFLWRGAGHRHGVFC